MAIAEIYMRCTTRFSVSIRAATSGQSRNLTTTNDPSGKGREVDRQGGATSEVGRVEPACGLMKVSHY
uniref:Uncharacterized protein n=1 Tax=Oryza punctata TaxID=4537 RepID=A0A0E0JYP3_ORYPU